MNLLLVILIVSALAAGIVICSVIVGAEDDTRIPNQDIPGKEDPLYWL